MSSLLKVARGLGFTSYEVVNSSLASSPKSPAMSPERRATSQAKLKHSGATSHPPLTTSEVVKHMIWHPLCFHYHYGLFYCYSSYYYNHDHALWHYQT